MKEANEGFETCLTLDDEEQIADMELVLELLHGKPQRVKDEIVRRRSIVAELELTHFAKELLGGAKAIWVFSEGNPEKQEKLLQNMRNMIAQAELSCDTSTDSYKATKAFLVLTTGEA
jgi:hypothetical protein